MQLVHWPLLGVKRTSPKSILMSANDPKRTLVAKKGRCEPQISRDGYQQIGLSLPHEELAYPGTKHSEQGGGECNIEDFRREAAGA
jgi:hypothetical protein